MFCNAFGRGVGFGPGNFTGMFWFMGIKLFIFIVLIILGIKLFKSYMSKSNSAMKILNEKFAGGEINEEEYLKRKTILSKKN